MSWLTADGPVHKNIQSDALVLQSAVFLCNKQASAEFRHQLTVLQVTFLDLTVWISAV